MGKEDDPSAATSGKAKGGKATASLRIPATSPPVVGTLRTESGRQANGVKGPIPASAPGATAPAAADRNAGTAGCGTSRTGATTWACASGNPAITSEVPAGNSENAGFSEAGDSASADGATGGEEGGSPHDRPVSALRATGMDGGRMSVNETSGNNAGGAAGSRCAEASNTSLH